MTRFRIGLGILLVLLILGLGAQAMMDGIHRPIADTLNAAGEQALAGNWEAAEGFMTAALASWEQDWRLTAALADHAPMEEIDSLMSKLPVHAHARDAVSFAENCTDLARRVQAMADAHRLNWWNLL